MNTVWRTLVWLAGPVALAAQEPRDTVELAPVVVTATRFPTPAADLPVAVTVLDGAVLRAQGIRTVAEALRSVPGAHVAAAGPYGGQTSLFLRGGNSDYVKVLIDGVPQNAPGGAYDFANLTTDDVERIEIVRGPVSVLYGSDAVTGVVQIFTRGGGGRGGGGGPSALHAAVSAAGGTYGTGILAAAAAAGGARGGYALNVTHFTSDGVYPVNNDYRNDVVSARVHWRPDARTDAAVALRYGDALYHFPTDASGDPVSNNQHQRDRGPSLGLEVGRTFSDRVEGRLSATWRRENYQYAIAPNGPTDSTTFPFRSSDWVARAGADARANVRVRPGAVVTAGAALERESMRGTTLDTSRARLGGAVYAQGVLTGRPLDATLGARLDDNERFGRYATYRAGAAWRLARGARAVASFGTGFKEPSFYQNFATGFVRGNPNLRPEHTFSWEAGLEWTGLDRRLGLGARYFDQRFRDLIDYNGADTVTNYFNVPGADARGVELTGDVAPAAGLHLTLAYTVLRTRVTAGGADTGATALYRPGQPLLRRPQQAGWLTVAYRPLARAGVTVAVAYTGDRADVDYRTFRRVTLPAYTRVDVAADVAARAPRDGMPGLTLRARIENLFDRAYEEIKNFPARRRTLLFGGEVRFGP
jgi:vitamin B12 transporter